MDEVDELLLQVYTLLDRIDQLEEAFVKHGICVNCYEHLKDCKCER